jgi:hypothetical protein
MKMPEPTIESGLKTSGCALPSLKYSIEGDKFVVRGKVITAEFLRQFRPGKEGQSSR